MAPLPAMPGIHIESANLIRLIQDSTTIANHRRDQLRSKNLLVIQGAWFGGKLHIFERLKDLGVNIIMGDTLKKYKWLALVEQGVIKELIALRTWYPGEYLL